MRGIRIEPNSVTIHDYADELETLQNEVGGKIDMITLPDGGVMIVDRDFMLKSYPLNENASAVAGMAIGGIALIFGRDGDRLADVPEWYLPLRVRRDKMREWTEEDEDRYRASERARKTALIDKIEKDARKRYEQAEENYQSAGYLSSYRSMEKWRDLLDLCSIARESMAQSCWRCEQRYKNGKALIEQLKGRKAGGLDKIDIEEAIGLIGDAAS